MKLLIITQKVDRQDPVLGFFHSWIEEFAKQCESVVVICLNKGDYYLPANVKVFSLGKEEISDKSRAKRKNYFYKVLFFFRFIKYIWQERKNYTSVFVHMNQVYVILGGWFWRLWHKKIGLWYTHGSVNTSLRLAEKITDYIFTASHESFRIESKKKNVVGHGIDVNRINKIIQRSTPEKAYFKIVNIGRISPIKKIEILIEAIDILKNKLLVNNIRVDIVGGPAIEEDKKYFMKLQNLVKEKKLENEIRLYGSVPNAAEKFLASADLFVHTGDTGGLDKAALEAITCNIPIISGNSAVKVLLDSKYIFKIDDADNMAKKILFIYHASDDKIRHEADRLKEVVVKEHNLEELIKKICKYYEK